MWTDNTAKVNSKTEVNTLSSLSSLFLTELKNNNDLLPISFYIYLFQEIVELENLRFGYRVTALKQVGC